nr:MAG TPA: Pumilio-family RNA binding repeat [Caudoviricetes sp.]DAX92934.1 MAG TPA: Pumilio-family RNA binding repeat [Caudoviricetes sp.]
MRFVNFLIQKCIKISQKMSKKMILWYIIDIH